MQHDEMALTLCKKWTLVDIGLNLTDKMFSGVYNGRPHHEADVANVLDRARQVGVRGVLLTGSSASVSAATIALCKRYTTDTLRCLCTVGCHPTHCSEFEKDPEAYAQRLDDLISEHSVRAGGCVAAIGELGLDYDRLFFCPREVQLRYFEKQLDLAERHRLPLFLHDRNTQGDFYSLLSQHRHRIVGGVVHSFTGSEQELKQYLELGLYIGINGCSLKTPENLTVARQVPLDRLLLETDAPWCDLRNTHASKALLAGAGRRCGSGKCLSDSILDQFKVTKKEKFARGSMVKGRCEPCNMVQVLEVMYELHRDEVESAEELARMVCENTCRLFAFQVGSAPDGESTPSMSI